MAYIKCENLKIGYEGRIIASNINFKMEKGDYVCIIGENGKGKTTLLKTIINLLKKIDGEIEFGDGLQKNEVAYVSQNSGIKDDFPATVWEICISGTLSKMGLKPFFGKKEKEIAIENLKRLDIYELKNKAFKTLSGGQKQRVLIARALSSKSKVLLLDEPITGLDPMATISFYQLLKELNNDGITILMISHDLEVLRYANKVIDMDENPIKIRVIGDNNE